MLNTVYLVYSEWLLCYAMQIYTTLRRPVGSVDLHVIKLVVSVTNDQVYLIAGESWSGDGVYYTLDGQGKEF